MATRPTAVETDLWFIGSTIQNSLTAISDVLKQGRRRGDDADDRRQQRKPMSRMRVEICLLNLHWREGDKHGRSRSRPREVVDVGGDRAPD